MNLKTKTMIPENYSEFYDMLIENGMNKPPNPLDDLEDCKKHLSDINHPKKDDASYCYEFWQFCNEPICIK